MTMPEHSYILPAADLEPPVKKCFCSCHMTAEFRTVGKPCPECLSNNCKGRFAERHPLAATLVNITVLLLFYGVLVPMLIFMFVSLLQVLVF